MREIHVGRLIDHVHLRASDLAAAKRFYRAVLGALGKPIAADDESHLQCDELWIDALGDDRRPLRTSTWHFRLAISRPCDAFTKWGSQPAAATMARPANGSTIPGISPPSCSTPTATMSKPYITGRGNVRRTRL
jgi:hypothetical protein